MPGPQTTQTPSPSTPTLTPRVMTLGVRTWGSSLGSRRKYRRKFYITTNKPVHRAARILYRALSAVRGYPAIPFAATEVFDNKERVYRIIVVEGEEFSAVLVEALLHSLNHVYHVSTLIAFIPFQGEVAMTAAEATTSTNAYQIFEGVVAEEVVEALQMLLLALANPELFKELYGLGEVTVTTAEAAKEAAREAAEPRCAGAPA